MKTTFWQTKIGSYLSHIIHETNTGLSYINSVKFYIEKGDHEKAIKFCNLAKDKIKKGVDYGYIKIKEEQGYK